MLPHSFHTKIALTNLYSLNSDYVDEIIIENKKIQTINKQQLTVDDSPKLVLNFENAIIFPGLINSHDHLDFNLFPKLGNKIYKDYLEWGNDIHANNKAIINSVLKIPETLRIQWGIYKNLFAGVTTVMHHGKYINNKDNLISIYQQYNALHSVQLEKYFVLKLNNPFAKPFPFVIHVGEGTNKKSAKEIDKLIKWNLFKKEIVAVHGIVMTEAQAKFFKALIWCADSNLFLQNKTAAIDKIKHHTTILFGTDSTVSAGWNIWHQLRLARKTNLLSDAELYNSATQNGGTIWKLNAGSIEEKKDADIVVAKRKIAGNYFNNFFSLNPEDILLVLHKGEIVLMDESLLAQVKQKNFLQFFSKIFIDKSCKYVKGNLSKLVVAIKNYLPEIQLPISIDH